MTWADTTRHTLALIALFALGWLIALGCSTSHTTGPEPGVECGSTRCAAGQVCCTGCGAPSCIEPDGWCECPDGGPPLRDAAPIAELCWGGPHDECVPWMYCRLEACGDGDAPGRCVDRPTSCSFEYAPVCSCDGVTYENRCAAEMAGASVAYTGECAPPPASCGGETGPCAGADEVCDWRGPGCGADGGVGTCVPRPEACEEIYAPVCGCDGETYGNECAAHAAGVEVDFAGTCDAPADRPCGGRAGPTCADDEYCAFPGDWCDWADGTGVCRPRPTACPDPGGELVCGCDGVEYIGECAAHAAGVDVAFSGSCADP